MMIRAATLDDSSAISAIFNEALRNTTSVYAYVEETVDDRRQWLLEKQDAQFPVIVEERDGQVVGFATYGAFRSRPAYQYTVEHSVYVAGAWRRHGIGEVLLVAIIELARQQELKVLVGGIDSANTESISLHLKHGFIYRGTLPQVGYKFGRWLDLTFYTLDLPGPVHPKEKSS